MMKWKVVKGPRSVSVDRSLDCLKEKCAFPVCISDSNNNSKQKQQDGGFVRKPSLVASDCINWKGFLGLTRQRSESNLSVLSSNPPEPPRQRSRSEVRWLKPRSSRTVADQAGAPPPPRRGRNNKGPAPRPTDVNLHPSGEGATGWLERRASPRIQAVAAEVHAERRGRERKTERRRNASGRRDIADIDRKDVEREDSARMDIVKKDVERIGNGRRNDERKSVEREDSGRRDIGRKDIEKKDLERIERHEERKCMEKEDVARRDRSSVRKDIQRKDVERLEHGRYSDERRNMEKEVARRDRDIDRKDVEKNEIIENSRRNEERKNLEREDAGRRDRDIDRKDVEKRDVERIGNDREDQDMGIKDIEKKDVERIENCRRNEERKNMEKEDAARRDWDNIRKDIQKKDVERNGIIKKERKEFLEVERKDDERKDMEEPETIDTGTESRHIEVVNGRRNTEKLNGDINGNEKAREDSFIPTESVVEETEFEEQERVQEVQIEIPPFRIDTPDYSTLESEQNRDFIENLRNASHQDTVKESIPIKKAVRFEGLLENFKKQKGSDDDEEPQLDLNSNEIACPHMRVDLVVKQPIGQPVVKKSFVLTVAKQEKGFRSLCDNKRPKKDHKISVTFLCSEECSVPRVRSLSVPPPPQPEAPPPPPLVRGRSRDRRHSKRSKSAKKKDTSHHMPQAVIDELAQVLEKRKPSLDRPTAKAT